MHLETSLSHCLTEGLLQQSQIAVARFDQNLRLQYVNQVFAELHHLSVQHAVGRQLNKLPPGSLGQVLSGTALIVLETQQVHRDRLVAERTDHGESPRIWGYTLCPMRNAAGDDEGGGLLLYELSTTTGMVHRYREPQRLSEEALTERVEYVSRLVGGVARSFDQLSDQIEDLVQQALTLLPEDHPARYSLQQTHNELRRTRQFASQVLAFASHPPIFLRRVDLALLFDEILPIVRRLLDPSIMVKTNIEPVGCEVVADPGLLDQVIVHLCLNARNTMPAGGVLSIRLQITQLTEHSASELNLASGAYVLLTIADTGRLTGSQSLADLFEPYEDHHPNRVQHDLRLALCYRLMSQMGGHIAYRKLPSGGSETALYWPHAR